MGERSQDFYTVQISIGEGLPKDEDCHIRGISRSGQKKRARNFVRPEMRSGPDFKKTLLRAIRNIVLTGFQQSSHAPIASRTHAGHGTHS